MDKVLNRIATAEVADVFHACSEEFLQSSHLCQQQQKAFNDIACCRTSHPGGHINICNHCGYKQQAYNFPILGTGYATTGIVPNVSF
jgi:hypothetical protein